VKPPLGAIKNGYSGMSKIDKVFLVLTLCALMACGIQSLEMRSSEEIPTATIKIDKPFPTSTETKPTVEALPTATYLHPSPTPWPDPWPINIEEIDTTRIPTCEELFKLKPGESTVQDVFKLIGNPSRRRDFPTGVVIGYSSNHGKFMNTILLDGITGKVLLVGAVLAHDDSCPYFGDLKNQYGEPVLGSMLGNRELLFFEGQNIAYTGNILQILPPRTTLEEYRLFGGYAEETFAFTP
jgi:hypothetical protein